MKRPTGYAVGGNTTSLPAHADEWNREALLEVALELVRQGCSLIPVNGVNKKPTLETWKVYQSKRATAVQVRRWAAGEDVRGFGVVCGAVSGGLQVLDFDVAELYPHFLAALPAWAASITFPTQQTGRGYQMLFRRPTPLRNEKLAKCKPFDQDGAVMDGAKLKDAIETRGEGGFAVIPGSLHPSGRIYRALNDWSAIPTITDEQADELLALARTFDQREQDPVLAPEPARKVPATSGKGKTPLTGGRAEERAAERREREVAAALAGEVARVEEALEGGRNDALNRAAMSLGRFIPHGELQEGDVIRELAGAARAVGLKDDEILPTIRSGLKAGKKKPADPHRYEDEERERGAAMRVGTANPALAEAVTAEPLQEAHQHQAEDVAERKPATLSDRVAAVPMPLGEGGSYGGEQLVALLNIPWPVLAPDTDKAHAYRLRHLVGGNLGYVPELGGYVTWNGRQWLSGGKDGAGQTAAKMHVQALGKAMRPEVDRLLELFGMLKQGELEAKREHGDDSPITKKIKRKAEAMEKAYHAHVRAAKGTESDAKQRAVLSSAKPLFLRNIREFDPHPWRVGFQNGTWDKGEWRESRREDNMLTIAAVDYRADADQGEWLEVLARITGGDADLARTLQEVAGYALSGASSLRVLPWLYGEAGTGKSTYSELLATVLGDLAATVDPKMFAADAARERLGATIWGKRVALCAEAGNQRLDAEALKTLSGGDRLSVRMLYAEAFTARAAHVLVMVANDPPRMDAYDEALKTRVLALPFNHPLQDGGPLLGGRRIEELRQDPNSALVAGFTAWAVEGLERAYWNGDIHRAEVCRQATRLFWEGVDPLADFWQTLDRELLLGNGYPVGQLRAMHEDWAKTSGLKPLTAHRFNKACLSVGLGQMKRTAGIRVWVMENARLYPADREAGQEAAEPRVAEVAENTPISQKPKTLLSRVGEKEKGFTENGPNSATSATRPKKGWEGDEL